MTLLARRLPVLLSAMAFSAWAADGEFGGGGAVRSRAGAVADLKPVVEAVAAARKGRPVAPEAMLQRVSHHPGKTAASGLYLADRFSYTLRMDTASIAVDRITNDTTATTGPLRLSLHVSTTRPPRGAAFSGHRLASFSTLPGLLPGAGRSAVTQTAPLVQPPAGSYWIVLALSGWDPSTCAAADQYCIEDSLVSDGMLAFGTPAPTVTLLGAASPTCLENVPLDVAEMLAIEAPGLYRPYSPLVGCASFGLRHFAGYLAGTGEAILVYADSASTAALLCVNAFVWGCSMGMMTGNYTDLWWNPAESGWGVSITQHISGVAFVAWYTYDVAGNPKWYVVSSCVMSDAGCAGTLYETSGPAFGPGFDASRVVVRKVGSLSFDFTGPDNGTMTYSVGGQTGVKSISRQPF